MAISVTFLPESELLRPLVRQILRAKRSVDMVYFYWKTRYTGVSPINEIVNAVKQAAKKEDVRVRVLLGYGSDVPSIQYLNYLTGQSLAAAGVEVRLAPTNRTTHAKITVVDGEHTFIGSHNVTRGAFSENAEASAHIHDPAFSDVAQQYVEGLFAGGVDLNSIPPPPPPATDDDAATGYFPPPLAPPLTVAADPQTHAAILEWSAASASFFAQYEIHRDMQPGVTEVSPLLVSLPYYRVTRYVDDDRNPTLPTYYRLYLYNTHGVSDGSAEVYLPATQTPEITLSQVTNENDALVCSFTVSSREGITAFAALSSPNADLSNSTKGPEFDETVSHAWVTPVANANDTVYVAVAAYADGVEIARSNIMQAVYQPVTPPPPPPGLTPPIVVSVTQIGPMGINVEYSHVTPADFARYEVQQRSNETWNTLATITTPETRSWSGGPVPYMDATHPVRVVVFVQSGDSAASDEMVITPM